MSGRRKQFDWQAIHAELERRLARLETTIEDDPARVEALLRERSRALAAMQREPRGSRHLDRALVFRMGRERYALSLDHAQEVTALSRTAVVPNAGAAVVGIVGWRGEFVFVFDLMPMLDLPVGEGRNGRRIIVLRDEEPRIALAADAVEGIVDVEPSALKPPGQLHVRHGAFFRGITTDAVMVLEERHLVARLTEELQAA